MNAVKITEDLLVTHETNRSLRRSSWDEFANYLQRMDDISYTRASGIEPRMGIDGFNGAKARARRTCKSSQTAESGERFGRKQTN